MNGNWLNTLQSAIESTVDDAPKDFKTLLQIASEIGKSRTQTGTLMRIAIAGGNVDVKLFRIKSGQVIRPVPHYRLK